jgi:hypothetical protein
MVLSKESETQKANSHVVFPYMRDPDFFFLEKVLENRRKTIEEEEG